MRKPFLGGICLGLILLAASTHSSDHVLKSDSEQDSWISSASDILHRVKRQFDFLSFFDKKTDQPPTTTQPGDDKRYTRSTALESVTSSIGPIDDEDNGQSGSGEPGGSDGWTRERNKPRNYRISLILMEPFNSEYRDVNSMPFKLLAESLTRAINQIYDDIPGDQQSRVIKIQEVDTFKIRVFLDLVSFGNHNTEDIRNVIKRQIESSRRIESYVVDEDFLFNEFGECEHDEMSCKDGVQCIPHSARCNGQSECADASDEEGCQVPTTHLPTVDSETDLTIEGNDINEGNAIEDKIPRSRAHGLDVEESSTDRKLVGTWNENSYEDRAESSGDTDHGHDTSIESVKNWDDFSDNDSNRPIISTSYGSTNLPEKEPIINNYYIDDKARLNSASRFTGGRDACRADDKVRCASDNSIFICNDQECDGHPDCPEGSDEENCPTTDFVEPNIECGRDEFICDMTRCILATKKCDGLKDCQDGTDEVDCPSQECGFRCRDGTCLNYNQKCNVIPECPEGDDELGCPGNNELSGRCPSGDFECRNGDCISSSFRCDRLSDCPDNSDEEDCPVDQTDSHSTFNPGPSKPCDGFTCDDGSCVETQHKCDGKIDCNDGSDENGCENIPRPTAPICLPGQSSCRDGMGCYFYNQTCDDHYDCSDHSDEHDCRCSGDEYRCKRGDCISGSKKCDRYNDCPDGDDEQDCPDVDCGPGQYRCRDGRCISSKGICDGYSDCPNGEDETNCSTDDLPTCLSAEFRCKNGECIQGGYRCDGLHDCSDNSDEDNCTDVCEKRDHICSDGTCIKDSKVCDNYVDCADGSDEQNCRVDCSWTEFTCENGDCIPNIDRCNKRPDCSDGSDEFSCPSSVSCTSIQFKCSSGDQCIHRSFKCDGKRDCSDSSDEWSCPAPGSSEFRCSPNEYQCVTGNQCIDYGKYCDGQFDCRDRSDEDNCDTRQALNLKTYPPEQTIKEGREVVFQCRDEGAGHVNVRWSRGDGLPLPPGSRDVRGRLEMPNIMLSHSGTYHCEAIGVPRNTAGARVSVYLKVEPFTVPTIFTPVCQPDQATCHNRECIPKNKVCDGVHDCGDGSDESRCSPWGCEPNEFSCDNKKCVRKSWVCDKDDDCGDGSDEKDCQLRLSGSHCYVNEFECADRKMCIPKWFHCDSHNDCHDGSDEIGCYPIKIVNVSRSMVILREGDTLELICKATGVPTPIISWRRNWQHVPQKCRSTSDNGLGTLTCPNMQEEDQGAYTCEALDFRNSILAPDTHVVVNRLSVVCPRGSFNTAARSPNECIPCFCFGATTDCRSSDNTKITIRPTILVARFVDVRYDPYRRRLEIKVNDPTIIPSSAARVSSDNVVQIVTPLMFGRRSFDQVYPYLALPESLHGNQLKSYGGELKYRLTFGGSLTQLRTTNPDVILMGNGYTLSYNVTDRLIPQSENDVTIRFLPGLWTVVEKPSSPDYSQSTYATRQDLMMALQNVENILVNFQYLEGELGETTISDIRMDSASVRNSGSDVAAMVEQCVCPAGYSGQSCEECASGYMRTTDGFWLGRCVPYVPKVCSPGKYGDPSRRIPCLPCPCPLTSPSNQFGLSCRLDTDDQPTCDCPSAYAGRRCEMCAPGYTGNPLIPNGDCRPIEDQCDVRGSYSSSPDQRTGDCDCKAHTTGARCDQCKPETFALSARHQHGCIDCFCMGITEECTSSNLYRDEVMSVFTSGSHGFLIGSNDDLTNMRNVSFDPRRREIMVSNFEPKVYYWVLPARFLGDKVTSYGGNLKYTLRYIPAPGGQSSRNNAPDVEIRSLNNINIVHRVDSPLEPGRENTITVPMLEQHWTREDGGAIDRPHLLMALADLSAIYIKATYTTNTLEAGLKSVSLDIANYRNLGNDRAVEVEQCRCPPGYIGTSCEDCDAGYTRTDDGLYLRFCEPCNCNNHSAQCHPETGVCENCRDNTAGARCEHCLPGFTKSSDGSCRDSRPCDCDPRGVSGPCTNGYCACKVNVIGDRCDECRPGSFGLSDERPEGCFECYCSGVTSQCQSSNLYREKIPTLVIDDNHGFSILSTPYATTTSLRDATPILNDFTLDFSRNEVGFDVRRRPGQRFFWSLPSTLTGDMVASYGGKLSFKLRYTGSNGLIQLEPDNHIILVSKGVTLFRHFNDDIIEANYPKLFEVDLIDDDNWKIMNPSSANARATRIDLLKALSGLEKILVLATFGDGIDTTHISDVAMDTAVPNRLGQEAVEVEVCRCPTEYKGTSCQQCNDHFYRQYDLTCRPCPCNGNDESCSLGPDDSVRCNCRPGYYGKFCENEGYLISEPTAVPEEDTKPSIIISITEPTIKIVEVGMTVRYNCSAVAINPGRRTSIFWSKEGGPLPSRAIKDDQGGLIITEVRRSDSGIYICTANDGYKSLSKSVSLVVGGNGARPRVRVSPESVDTRIGDSMELSCEATGTPRPSISWLKLDGSAISPYSQQYEGILRIDPLRQEDEGDYECTASNSYGSDTVTVQVRLRDTTPERILTIIQQGGTGALEGDTIYMTCSSSRNIYRLSWSRPNGRPLPQMSRELNGTLTIFGARAADQGVYVCTAHEISSGRAIATSEAIVNIGTVRQPVPVVSIDPDKQTVPQGSPAMIRCTTTQPGVRIRWSKREDSMPSHVQVNGGTLKIQAVRVTDRGMYICTVQYGADQINKYAILEVEPREAPTIELYPRVHQVMVQGSSMLVQCRASGIPPPNVYWSRPRNQSIPYNIKQGNNGILKLLNVQVSDAGQYVCHAENTAGSTTATVNIEVHSLPVVRISPRGPATLQMGQSLKLECNASGYPQPYVSWFRVRSASSNYPYQNSKENLSGPSYNHSVFDLRSAKQDDEGLYICTARNDAGTSEERIEVVVNDNNVNRPEFDDGDNEIPDGKLITIMGGESTQIFCSLSNGAGGRVRVEWTRADSRPMPEGSYQSNGALNLNNVNKDVEGVYTCLLIDQDTNAILKQKQTTVTVNYPPRITLVPQRQVVRVGDNARIHCNVTGEEPITISWEPIERSMPPSVSTEQGYLMFHGIRISDAGRYVCKARNLIAESAAVAEVIVNEETTFRPVVTAIDRLQTVPEGSKVELQCSADATIQMNWIREGGANCCELPPQAVISGNSLILEYANPEDSGRYRCTGVSTTGMESHDSIDLTVYRVQNIELKIVPSIDIIKVGDTFDLRCQPSGVPNSQLSWTKVGDRLAKNVEVLENVLKISDVTTRNNGVYRCSARTTTGHYEKDFILGVRDHYNEIPTGTDETNGITDHVNGYGHNNDYDDNNYDNVDNYDNGNGYDTNYNYDNGNDGDDAMSMERMHNDSALETKTADVGKPVVINCKNNLEPPVSYQWSKLGQNLPANTFANQSTLTISKLSEQDAGLYFCMATNGPVRMEKATVVTVTGLIPSFHQNPISYLMLPVLLDAHVSFDIEITFKPEHADGLILYNGQKQDNGKHDGDFISFGLKSGRPEFRFNVGSGPAVISSDSSIKLNQWHTVRLTRKNKDGKMYVDGKKPIMGSSSGRYQGLDLNEPMYLGSVPRFDEINPLNGFSNGFVGCITELKIGGISMPINKSDVVHWEGIGDCETCRDHKCENGGVCQQSRNKRGYSCLCPRGFSNENCTKLGESCFEGACGIGKCVEADRGIRCKCPKDKTGDRCEKDQNIKTPQFVGNSYIAYKLHRAQQKLKMTVMFKATDSSDGILLYSSPNGTSHFLSLAIKNKRLEFLYDNGYGLSQVKSNQEVMSGEWLVATIGADDNEIYLNFQDDHHRNRISNRPGAQRSVTGSLLYLGGLDPILRVHPSVGVRKGFTGCISSIDVHGHNLNLIWTAEEASGIVECAKESASSISCRPNTCKNKGICSVRNNRLYCACLPGYSGAYCENVEDECITNSPCRNGGTCEKSQDGSVRCLCPPTVAGDKCEDRLEGDVSFKGDGYIELDNGLMMHDDPSEAEVIEIEFTTTSPDGLLLWQGQLPGTFEESDYLSIAVVDGHIDVRYDLGSGPARIQALDGPPVDDGRRHKVVVTRTGSDAQVRVDSLEVHGSSQGIVSALNTPGNIFLGGAPEIEETTGGKFSKGFSGCIHMLKLPYQGIIDLAMDPMRSLNALPCSNENFIRNDDRGPTRGDSVRFS